jgi:hypothetical protein
MKSLLTSIRCLAALACLALFAGCATDLQEKENLTAAAGFKVIKPSGPDQQAMLAKLPPGKVTQVTHQGKPYYVLPDAKNNQAWVGGPKQYQAYQQLRTQQQISNENLMAAQSYQMQTMNVGMWGGWGVGWGPGWY